MSELHTYVHIRKSTALKPLLSLLTQHRPDSGTLATETTMQQKQQCDSELFALKLYKCNVKMLESATIVCTYM